MVLVDWLGRAGIAQTTEAWALELHADGARVTVVTRDARELTSGVVDVVGASARVGGRLAAHRAVARTAAATIRDIRPSVVVVQNYVLPQLEGPVFAAARSVGARVVLVVHDHRLHSPLAGWRSGLAARVRDADAVVTHTHFVADGVRAFSGRSDVEVVPHPVQLGMLRHEPAASPFASSAERWAVHFGVVKRRYKGASLVAALAAGGAEGWRFAAAGVGATADGAAIRAFPGYLAPGVLVGIVRDADVTLAPYTYATQSGTVVLAHVLGSVPVATAVGGIPEQIDDGVDGLLIGPGCDVSAWRDALNVLADDDTRKQLAVAGEARAWRDHAAFAAAVRTITS